MALSNNLPAVRAVALLGDGKLLVGGQFTQVGKNAVNDLVRLNKDGSLDKSYGGSAAVAALQGSNPNGGDQVVTFKLQADGKLLVALQIITANGLPAANSLYRLNADGTLDAAFNPGGAGTSTSGPVNVIALENDGKILIGGNFTSYNGAERNFFTRLRADGTLDNTFTQQGQGFSSTVLGISQQPDGKLLVGGLFIQFDRITRIYAARINPTSAAPAVTVSLAAQTPLAVLGAKPVNGAVTVTRRGGNLTLPLPVYYTLGGDARNGVDYRNLSGAVTILANKTTARILVRPRQGPTAARSRKVTFKLSLVSPRSVGFLNAGYAATKGQAVVKIIDDGTK